MRMAAAQALSSAPASDRRGGGARGVPGAVLENGCIELVQRLETRRRELFVALSTGWLGRASQPFFGLAQTLLQELLGMDGSHVEIERKFLLKELPKLPQGAELVEIEQGYLGDGTTPERLRRARSGRDVRHFRTVKLGRGESRVEMEQELSAEEFARLWPGTEGCRVEKRRHRVRAAQGVWEIDEFTDRDLVLAELEIPEAGLRIELPDWLAPSVLRDVTDDPAYGNLALARAGHRSKS
jgi:CYTH domain-containing protein